MSWARYILIAPKDTVRDVKKALSDFKFRMIHEKDGFLLYVAEGRSIPEFNKNDFLLLGLDARHITWFKIGNPKLARIFSARIELQIGFEAELEASKDLRTRAHFSSLMKEIDSSFGVDQDKALDRFGALIHVDLGDDDEINKKLIELAEIFESESIAYKVAYFDGQHGIDLGELDPEMNYIGPCAYVCASWNTQSRENSELLLNYSESLLDGTPIDELR